MNFMDFAWNPTTWITVTSVVVFYLYRLATRNFDVFEKQGIPGPKPWPVVGNMWGLWRENLPRFDVRMIQKYGKTYGSFDGTTPILYTIDEHLIKAVFVKDFDRFINKRDFYIKNRVVRMFVSLMKDQEWKDVRSSITPVFTTGKIKRMSVLIKECADNLAAKLEKTITENNGEFEVKKTFSAFTMDVIARCAFAMKIDSLGEKDDPFVTNASVVFNSPMNRKPAIIIPFIFRRLGGYFANPFLDSDTMQFFVRKAEELAMSRENSPQKYHDFVEIATEAMKEVVKSDSTGNRVPMWSKDEATELVIAQAVLFLLAGFESTGSTLTTACFMLAKHPDVQERLYGEITAKLEQTDGEINHDVVNGIPYVEQILNETMRLYPAAARVERECSGDVTYGNITIKKGMTVAVPVQALHLSDEYYRDPKRFNPDRWSPENKGQISPYVFLPFGTGPRNCVGMRFAMEEMKFALCTIVQKFRFYTVKETPEQVKIRDGLYSVIQLENFKLGVELR